MPDTSLVKAKIINLDNPSQEVECLFNPKEYTFTKQNSWSRGETPSTNVPQLEFSGGQPATLAMHLLFDTYTSARPGSKPKDVRKVYTDKLWSFMMIDPDLKDPKSTRGVRRKSASSGERPGRSKRSSPISRRSSPSFWLMEHRCAPNLTSHSSKSKIPPICNRRTRRLAA